MRVMMTTENIVTVGPGTSIMETLRLMGERDIHHLPVLSGDRWSDCATASARDASIAAAASASRSCAIAIWC